MDALPGLVACEVESRGRFLVAVPYLTPAAPLTLGRRGSVPAPVGELALVQVAPGGGRARVVERLGDPADVRVLLHALAGEAGAARPFPAAVQAAVARLPADPPPPSGARRDRRGQLAFTVDPGSAKDHDDAIAIEREGDGFRVFVHIADVAAVVEAGGPIDGEALRRGFSSYLPGRVDPMLPPALSAGLCSLVPGRPRDVVTVEVPVGADLRPGAPAFGRSQIVSARRFSYDEVERILAGAAAPTAALDEAVRDAARIAGALRVAREARGALMLPSSELEIDLAGDRVADARLIGEPAAHALVEELMILANEAVAELLAARRAPALFRVHDQPDPDAVVRLYDQLADLGVPTPPLPDPLVPSAAGRAVGRAAATMAPFAAARGHGAEAFTTLVLRSVQTARYGPANGGHAGLASVAYCHFTSPIRRYPDLTVHRAVLAVLGLEPEPARGGLAELAVSLSAREREWTVLERRGAAVCLASLARERLLGDPDADMQGEVTGLIGGGLFVRFAGAFDGFLPSRWLAREHLEVNALGTALVGLDGRRWRLGDPARVRLERVDVPRGRVTLVGRA